MKKRIIPLMTVLCLLLCLLPSAAFAAETGGTVDTSRSYNFEPPPATSSPCRWC